MTRPKEKLPPATKYQFFAIDKKKKKSQWYRLVAEPIGVPLTWKSQSNWLDDEGETFDSRETALQAYRDADRTKPRLLEPGTYTAHATSVRHIGDLIVIETKAGRIEIDVSAPPTKSTSKK